MAAYHKVEVSLNTNAVEVGIPSPQSVTVTVPTVGPVGPQGPAGPKGDPGDVSGSIAWDNVTDKPASFTPSAHSSTHHTGGADQILPQNIGAQSLFVTTGLLITGNTTLTAGRALIYSLTVSPNPVTADITLPSSGHLAGDIIVVRSVALVSGSVLTIKSPLGATLDTINAAGQAFRYTAITSGSPNAWTKIAVDTHTHPASDITGLATVATSGDYDDLTNKPTLGTAAASATTDFAASSHTHAAADITSGTLDIARIPTGTSSTTVCIGDDARLSDARTPTSHTHGNLTNDGKVGSTSGLPLKTGTAGVVEAGAFGGGAGEFAEGNHTHADLHTRSHAITSTSDHTAGNHKVFYSDGSGQIQELALGNSGEVLTSNGATSAPSFAAASGGSTDFSDSAFRVSDNGDSSKKVALECSGISASTTRTLTVANRSGTVVVSDTSAGSGSDVVNNIVSLTTAEYNAIGSPDAATLYLITDP